MSDFWEKTEIRRLIKYLIQHGKSNLPQGVYMDFLVALIWDIDESVKKIPGDFFLKRAKKALTEAVEHEKMEIVEFLALEQGYTEIVAASSCSDHCPAGFHGLSLKDIHELDKALTKYCPTWDERRKLLMQIKAPSGDALLSVDALIGFHKASAANKPALL